MDPEFIVRKATSDEIEEIVSKWEDEQGWGPGLTDPQLFLYTDPNGFLVGVLNGKPIVSLYCVKCPRNFGFIGIFICRKEHRGQGYGLATFKTGMKYLEGRNISLQSVLAQEDKYVRSGFKTTSFTSCRSFLGTEPSEPIPNIENLKVKDFEKIYQYWLSRSTGFDKEFSSRWISHEKHHSFGFFEENQLKGFAVMRPANGCHKVGPLIAETPEIATKLLRHMRELVGAKNKILTNFILRNDGVQKILKGLESNEVYLQARMFTQSEPLEINYSCNFAITAAEVG